MKAYFVLCILLASILFFPSSLLARELAAGESGGTVTPSAGNPVTKPCNPVKGKPYGSCAGKPPKSRPCNSYRGNCAPNSSP